MKKDIVIPPSEGISLGLIKNDENFWDMYLINKKNTGIRNILITSEAKGVENKSSTLRYFLEKMEEISYIKFESVLEEVMTLNNFIFISYYIGIDIFEKKFEFSMQDLAQNTPQIVPLVKLKGYELE